VTNTITAYFRAPFVLPLGAANALLRLQPLVADGAVFWLNGSELFRIGLPKDPVTHLTPASRSVALPAYEGPFDFAAPSLVAGTNILAVEIHKTTAEGAQLVIGAMLDALILPSQLPAPVLHITPQEGAVTLAWSEPGMTLEMAANVAGPWVPQPGLVSPTTLPGTNAASFFRLRQ
jgi:hypothetical protein